MTLPHYGLYFTPAHVQTARDHADRPPFAAAWTFLRTTMPSGIDAAVWGGLRYRLDDQPDAAALAADIAACWVDPALMEGQHFIAAARDTALLAHAHELIRDFDGGAALSGDAWRAAFAARVDALNARPMQRIDERYWLNLVNLVAGIVLEREEAITTACAEYQRAIATDISPRGYIEAAVMGKDGGAMVRQIRAAGALVLMAEAAAHIGVDLWGYHVRGVSVMTTAVYPIYYAYTTAKWKWDADYPVEDVQALFREYGGYLEIVARRMATLGTTPSKDVNVILADMRPIADVRGGGLTTLTHAQPERARRRGLFG
jgi:hypothetical protein